MDRSSSTSSSGIGRSRASDLKVSSSTASGVAARRLNFTPKTGLPERVKGGTSAPSQMFEFFNPSPVLSAQTASAPASEQFDSRGSTPFRRQKDGLTLNSSAEQEKKIGSTFSFSRVQAAGGAQGSIGREPGYWPYAAPSPTSAEDRSLAFRSRYDLQSAYLEPESKSGSLKPAGSGNIERILGTNPTTADKTGEPATPASLRQMVVPPNDEGLEEEEQMQDVADWHEHEEGQDPGCCSDDVAKALWEKRIPRTSTQYPICSRTSRERCAYTTSDDWAIFALHNQYVRPLRDREWVPGEPCIIRRNSFELPPGAYRYSESSCGIPATAFESFVFPNPPRQFLISARGRTSGNVGFAPLSSSIRMSTSRNGNRGRCSQLTQQQLLDLERMLWFDPEPRLERPFRLYADSKTCLKGRLYDIGHIMRSGW